jgi:hypothetical protein
MTMTLRTDVIALAALAVLLPASARAQSADDYYNIMRPEKDNRSSAFEAWRAPNPKVPHNRRRGSSNPVYPTPLPQPDHFVPTPLVTAQPNLPTVQPYVVSPQTGRALPNLDQGRPETGQDRAMRCAHQAGVYGETGGSYLGSCINQ